MSCSNGRMTKKRIITLAVVIIGAAAAIYGVSLATKNFAVLALPPVVLGFLCCPLMCGVIGGVLWLTNRHSGNKQKMRLDESTSGCCQSNHDHSHKDQNEINDHSSHTDSSISHPKIGTGDDIHPDLTPPEQMRQREFKNSS